MSSNCLKNQISVAYHAYASDGQGGHTFTDDPTQTIGWSAYARTEPDDSGEFDVLDEAEFETEIEAHAAAQAFAFKYGTDLVEKY